MLLLFFSSCSRQTDNEEHLLHFAQPDTSSANDDSERVSIFNQGPPTPIVHTTEPQNTIHPESFVVGVIHRYENVIIPVAQHAEEKWERVGAEEHDVFPTLYHQKTPEAFYHIELDSLIDLYSSGHILEKGFTYTATYHSTQVDPPSQEPLTQGLALSDIRSQIPFSSQVPREKENEMMASILAEISRVELATIERTSNAVHHTIKYSLGIPVDSSLRNNSPLSAGAKCMTKAINATRMCRFYVSKQYVPDSEVHKLYMEGWILEQDDEISIFDVEWGSGEDWKSYPQSIDPIGAFKFYERIIAVIEIGDLMGPYYDIVAISSTGIAPLP